MLQKHNPNKYKKLVKDWWKCGDNYLYLTKNIDVLYGPRVQFVQEWVDASSLGDDTLTIANFTNHFPKIKELPQRDKKYWSEYDQLAWFTKNNDSDRISRRVWDMLAAQPRYRDLYFTYCFLYVEGGCWKTHIDGNEDMIGPLSNTLIHDKFFTTIDDKILIVNVPRGYPSFGYVIALLNDAACRNKLAAIKNHHVTIADLPHTWTPTRCEPILFRDQCVVNGWMISVWPHRYRDKFNFGIKSSNLMIQRNSREGWWLQLSLRIVGIKNNSITRLDVGRHTDIGAKVMCINSYLNNSDWCVPVGIMLEMVDLGANELVYPVSSVLSDLWKLSVGSDRILHIGSRGSFLDTLICLCANNKSKTTIIDDGSKNWTRSKEIYGKLDIMCPKRIDVTWSNNNTTVTKKIIAGSKWDFIYINNSNLTELREIIQSVVDAMTPTTVLMIKSCTLNPEKVDLFPAVWKCINTGLLKIAATEINHTIFKINC